VEILKVVVPFVAVIAFVGAIFLTVRTMQKNQLENLWQAGHRGRTITDHYLCHQCWDFESMQQRWGFPPSYYQAQQAKANKVADAANLKQVAELQQLVLEQQKQIEILKNNFVQVQANIPVGEQLSIETTGSPASKSAKTIAAEQSLNDDVNKSGEKSKDSVSWFGMEL